MKTKINTVLAVAAIGGIAVGVYFYKKSKEKTEKPTSQSRVDEDIEKEELPVIDSVFPLAKGSIGDEVKVLQQFLNRSKSCASKMPKSNPNARMMKILPLVEDGIFGDMTERAFKICYQSESVKESTFKRIESALNKMAINL